jgi:hypothetical protein
MLTEFLNLRKYPENVPTMQEVVNMTYGCHQLLEPARVIVGPIIINSGYRNETVNRKVGGVKNSQHTKGEAADIVFPDIATGRCWFDWIRKHCPFNQLIWEHAGGKTWIHVSCCRNEDKNRKQVIQ